MGIPQDPSIPLTTNNTPNFKRFFIPASLSIPAIPSRKPLP